MNKSFFQRHALGAALCLAGGLLLAGGCRDRQQALAGRIASAAELNTPEFVIGSMTGSAALRVAREHYPQARIREYAMPVDAFTALCSSKLDAVVLDRPTLKYMTLAHPGLALLPEDLAGGRISTAAAKRSTALMRQVNGFIRQYRLSRCREMQERWFNTRNPAMPEIPRPAKPDGVLRVGITANNEPLCFIKNGKLAGFDAEFALRLGAYLNKTVVFTDMPYDALVIALEGGRIDLAVAYMDALPEREESVLFSEPYVDAPVAVLVHRALLKKAAAPEEAGAEKSWIRSLAESFQKTFLRENRWILILQGLGTTVVITFFAVLFGTLLAFPLCMMCRSGRRWQVWLGERFISIVMGMPIFVILMILYYVIFAKVDVSGIVVAVLGFALEFAAYAGVTLRAGIDGVPRGQTEAALALGHRPPAVFWLFVLPQAVRSMLPVYRGEIISTLKATSIVGYVAIMDLTKMGDIIRSRTYEAFFPLIAIAAIYFFTAKGLTALLLVAEKRLDPKRRRQHLQKGGF